MLHLKDRRGQLMFPPPIENLPWKKAFWKHQKYQVWDYLCPLCKVPRRLPFHPRPGTWMHIFQIGLTTAVLTLLFWPWWHIKGTVVFLPLWIGFETFYRVRTRAAMRCTRCGFDPYLYHIDLDWARREVDAHWRKQFEDKGIPYPEKARPGTPSPISGASGGKIETPSPSPPPSAP